MKRIIFTLLIASILQSCARVVPLNGKYQEGAVKTKIDMPFESVWEKVIDMVANTGLAVRIIDKSSGIIISENNLFSSSSVTIEDNKYKILDPKASFVREKYPTERVPLPYNVSATWNLRVKEIDKKTTVLSLILHDISVREKSTTAYRGVAVEKLSAMSAVSTGNYEKWIIEEILKP